MSGIGAVESWDAAGPLAKESADTGSCIGQFVMGLQALIIHGYVEAAVWFYEAAEQGHATSQFNLGLMFLEGKGVPQDKTAATSWLEKASAQVAC
jgi:TPR repeat protein